MPDLILERTEGPIVVLTLNDPARANPLSAPLVEALRVALERAAAADDIRAVVCAAPGGTFRPAPTSRPSNVWRPGVTRTALAATLKACGISSRSSSATPS